LKPFLNNTGAVMEHNFILWSAAGDKF